MTAAEEFFHEGSRLVQDANGTRRLADHIAERYVSAELDDAAAAMVRAADCFYLATADRDGRPDCSYKGGLPGFVRVPSRTELAFPSYDGNGMFRSLGNMLVNPAVGLLFVDLERPLRLRVNGVAQVSYGPSEQIDWPGADAVVRVSVREVFENCPRYLHDRANGTYSAYCPRPGHTPPEPEWKLKAEYDPILRSHRLPPEST